jgi:predicted O-methyltransferase YrrM
MRWEEARERLETIPNLLLEGQGRWLFETAQAVEPGGLILEIGPFEGYSTTCLGLGSVESQAHIVAIDTFEGNKTDFVRGRDFNCDILSRFRSNIRSCGLEDRVTVLVGESSVFWDDWNLPISFLFIDGSHQLEDVRGDFIRFYPHVIPCGIVAMHDVDYNYPWPGPIQVWNDYALWMLESRGSCITTLHYGLKPCLRS